MTNNNLDPDVRGVIEGLREQYQALSSPGVLAELRDIDQMAAAALRREILRLVAFLDDSVSNSLLGSLFHRSGDDPLNQMSDNLAAAYGVSKTYAGTTGTTGLNVPAVMSLAGPGEGIGIGRDCHVSVIAGVCLSGAEPFYLMPPFESEWGILLPPTPEQVAGFLDMHRKVRALVLTMPTYHGLMGDVAGIVEECQRRRVRLMVDEAHGPHFHFLRSLGFPPSAESAGADLVTQSTHKVMSALNQGSLLHFNDPDLARRYEHYQAMGFQSTSFSYPILMSLEHAVEQMLERGPALWSVAAGSAARLREGASKLAGIRVLDETVVDGTGVIGLDPTRVTIDVSRSGISGYELARRLLNRGVIVELESPQVVLFLVGPGTSSAQVDQELWALRDALTPNGGAAVFKAPPPPALPDRVLTPREAVLHSPSRRVAKQVSIGKVCAETIGCYPPGQAVFVAGERVTAEGVQYLNQLTRMGASLKRVQDDGFRTIEIVV